MTNAREAAKKIAPWLDGDQSVLVEAIIRESNEAATAEKDAEIERLNGVINARIELEQVAVARIAKLERVVEAAQIVVDFVDGYNNAQTVSYAAVASRVRRLADALAALDAEEASDD